MYKKSLAMLLLGAFSVFVSCVDKNYDIVNKDISTDIKIDGNTVVLPFGSLEAITLDSLIDVDDVDILEKGENGMYSICIDDSISPVEVEIDSVKLKIDPQTHSVDIDFENVEIDTVHIEATHIDPAKFNAPEISLEELNDKLPVLKSDVNTEIANEQIDEFFENINNYPSSTEINVAVDHTVGTGEQEVDCSFEYTLPDEVETIYNILLSTREDAESKYGTLVNVVITDSEVLNTIEKVVRFKITFPDYFVLHTDEYELSPGKNEITVSGMKLKENKNVISFYIKEIKDVDKKIQNGVIKIDESVKYTLDYDLSGSIKLTKDLSREDLMLNVKLDVPLAFKDVKGKTTDIDVDFDPIIMDFKGHFDDLEYIDTIYYVDFNEEASKLRFESFMETDWINEFKLKKGYALKVAFPENLEINDEKSTYEGKGREIVYDAADHAFYVYDLKALGSTHWNLALDRLTLNVPVNGHECDIDVEAGIYFVNENKDSIGNLVLEGVELESMVGTLDNLKGEKSAEFNMETSDLVIDDAVVHTTTIKSDLDTSTDFTFNEEIPEEIGCLKSIEFTDDVVMTFDLAINGLDELDTEIHLDLHAVLPSFLKLATSPKRSNGIDVTVSNDTLYIDADINPHTATGLSFDVVCKGLDFVTEEFGYEGLVPSDSTDGKSYISYDGVIHVAGDAYIDEVDLHSDILEKLDDIVFDMNFDVDEMQVKTFHGFYVGEIDEVEESFELDLGDELDFLKEEGNSVTLAEPQIEILLQNTICVPVDMDMQIFGRDDNGEIIPTSVINKRISVKSAQYDEKSGEIIPVETKLFLTCDSSTVAKIGYDNVEIKELANLLEKVPNTIDFKIKPTVSQSQTHHVDLTKPLKFTGSYNVNIPLKFDKLNITYNETVDDIADSFGENLDMLYNIKVNAGLDITNTIPLALKLNVKAIDLDGKAIESIEVEPVMVKAGLGGKIVGSEQEAQKVKFEIKSSTGDFSTLDKLELSVEAASDHTTGSASLMSEQGIKISDIILEINADIETDLDD